MEKTWYALIAFVLAWFVAQAWKVVWGLIKGYKSNQPVGLASLIGYVVRSGGMPSGHTASLTAMVVCLGYVLGYDSAVFILGIGVWIIVVYDAVNVRYAVGEQGKALNSLLEMNKKPILPVVEGHTVLQVIVGAIIGVLIGLGMGYLASF
ncbi:divergent PAP2 family protein [Bacteroides acidifaciens]|uniref:divergent PAP2 family protein n=1 Tax=Bacteroides acidifaciens TaxID=85831 RepID=UPI0030146C82